MESYEDLTMESYEDLKAFDQRLTEVVSGHRPSMFRRRKLLAVLVFAACMLWYMFPMPMSFWMQAVFTVATIIIIIALFRDHQKPEIASEEIASQARSVLKGFNMSCDDRGRVIVWLLRARTPNTSEMIN